MASGRASRTRIVILVTLAAVVVIAGSLIWIGLKDRDVTAPLPRATTSAQPSTSATIDPTDQQAIDAYQSFVAAERAAEMDPTKNHSAQLAMHAVDPALGNLQGVLASLAAAGVANRGTPPISRVKVIPNNAESHPWPTVTVVDCPTVSPTWKPYYVKTGKPVAQAPAKAPPPYAVTVEVIFYNGRWAVSKSIADRSHTCSP